MNHHTAMSQLKKQSQTGIQLWISCLRITATIAVVLIHTCGSLVTHRDLFGTTAAQIKSFTTIQSLCSWAVPVFFMITGSLLLRADKGISYVLCLKKYSLRIFACLLLFGAMFKLMDDVVSGNRLTGGVYKARASTKSLAYIVEDRPSLLLCLSYTPRFDIRFLSHYGHHSNDNG